MTKLNVQNPELSFHATPNQTPMLSTVIENDCSEATSAKKINKRASESNKNDDTPKPDENEPIKDQIPCISSTEELISDPIPTQNVSVNIDHVEKKIIFEVSETAGVDVTIIDVPTPQIVQPNTAQGTSVSKCDSFIGEMGGHLNKSQAEPSNQTVKFMGEIYMMSDTSMVNSPPIVKNATDEHVRTPIGKLVIRKLAHSNRFENTQYAVEMVHKVRQSREMFNISSASYGMDYDYDNDVIGTPDKAYPLPRSSPIASKATHHAYHFPYSPRIVLHRISTLQEYRQHYGTSQPDTAQATSKPKRKAPRTKSARTKGM